MVQVEYAQDWLTEAAETSGDNKQAEWRTDPERSGAGGSIGDIGTHAFNLAEFVSGLAVESLAADLQSFVEGRRVDDNAHMLLRYAGGARGMLWCSQVAPGNENGLRLRVYGDRGGLEWAQEDPSYLWHTPFGEPKRKLTRGGAGFTEDSGSRIPAGHPEGYLEGFANIYTEAADLIEAAPGGPDAGAPSAHRRGRAARRAVHRRLRPLLQAQRRLGRAVKLTLSGIDRSFGDVQVLFDVDLVLNPGEVHALIGENGAGKSTTMKIMSGYLAPTAGQVLLDDVPATFAGSQDAEARGVVLIHQEFNLAEQLTVEQNVFLGHELKRGPFLDKRAMRARTQALLERLNCTVSPDARVRDISNPDKQMVEIAKALAPRGARAGDGRADRRPDRAGGGGPVRADRPAARGGRGDPVHVPQARRGEADLRPRDRPARRRVVAQATTAEMSEDDMATAMVGRDVSASTRCGRVRWVARSSLPCGT